MYKKIRKILSVILITLMFGSNFTSILFAGAVDLGNAPQISQENVIVEQPVEIEPVIVEPIVQDETVESAVEEEIVLDESIVEDQTVEPTIEVEPVIVEPTVEVKPVLEQPVMQQSVPVQEVNSGKPNNNDKVEFCHVPPGNENNPQTISTSMNAYLAGHQNHGHDYMGKCRKPDIKVKKTHDTPIDKGNGVYEIKYYIEVKNTGGTGLYTLTDDINIPYGVTHVVSGLSFVSDDDGNPVPAVNPSFNGDSKDTIILNEVILANNMDKFSYKVTYTIDSEISSNDVDCKGNQTNEEIILVKNMASALDKKLRDRERSNWATTQFRPNHRQDENDANDAICIELKIPKMEKTIVVNKIVCDNEEDLPNWGAGVKVNENTASNFLAQNQDCHLVPDRKFQWSYAGVSNPGNSYYGEAGAGWNTFKGSVGVPFKGHSQINIREVLEEGYIPFSGNNNNNETAELYCETDGGNYDNEEWIKLSDKKTYNCVAFNTKKPSKVNIVAKKIVCDDESYLPNWGLGGNNITATTASEFLAKGNNAQHCKLEDWKFQWGNGDITNPGDSLIGEAGAGWNTFLGTTQIDTQKNKKIWVREVLKEDYIPFSYGLNSNTNVNNVSAEIYCHNDVMNYDNYDSVVFDKNIDTYHCIAFNHKPQVKIVAHKIVCEDEADLPNNFGGNLSVINSNTAQNWVNSHDSCRFVAGWNFQYGFNEIVAPAGTHIGASNIPGWNTFGMTDANGMAEASIMNIDNVSKIKVREILQEDYIPFTDTMNPSGPEYTAELYCGTDIQNYDNEEWIMGDDLGYGKTVHCIAWNAPERLAPIPVCGNNSFSVNNDGDLSIIDFPTGDETYINDLAFGSSAAGVDPVTGNVYYIERMGTNPRLGMYDITNHTNTIIGNIGTQNKVFTKMAFNSAGVLYAMTENTNSELYRINTTTGVATYIDSTPLINRDGGDLVFDDNGDMYVIVKDGKFYRVAFTNNSTTATFIGNVKYNGNNIQSTGLVFKNGLFYVADNNQRLYSFSLSDIGNADFVSSIEDSNDLATCAVPVIVKKGSVGGYKFNDKDKDGKWDKPCGNIFPYSTMGQSSRCRSHEYGIEGWEIKLTSKSNPGVVYTSYTDETGKYLFTDIPVGEYKICEVQQNGWTQTYPANKKCHDVTITVGPCKDYNFGNYKNWICNASTGCGNGSSNSVSNNSSLITPSEAVENTPQVSTFQEDEDNVVYISDDTTVIETESEVGGIGGVYADYLAKTKQLSEMSDSDEKNALQNYLNGSNISVIFRMAISRFVEKLETLSSDKRSEKTLEIFSRLDELSQNFEEGNVLLDILDYFKLQLAISYYGI